MEYKIPSLPECKECIFYRDIGRFGYCTALTNFPYYYDHATETLICQNFVPEHDPKRK